MTIDYADKNYLRKRSAFWHAVFSVAVFYLIIGLLVFPAVYTR